MGQIIHNRLSRFWHACEFAYRHILNRSLPHGVMSLRYLLLCQSRKIQIHRRLWLCGLPRVPIPLYIMMEIFLCLRWVLFSGWQGTLRSVRRLGPGIKNREGIGLLTQFKRVLVIALFYCAPPSEVYAFRLYRKDQRSTAWNYVFTHELQAFHSWRDLRHGKTAESLQVLGDKHRTIEILHQHRLPVVPVLALIPPAEDFNLSGWLERYPRLFVKPCHGSAGRGCFVVKRNDNGPYPGVFETRAGLVASRSTWDCLRKLSAKDDYLVQPFMTNHPALAGLCETDDAVTVRIITEVQDSLTVRYYAAMLEVPGSRRYPKSGKKKETGGWFHVILPIDLSTGKIMRFPEDLLHPSAKERYEPVYAKMGRCTIPFWEEMRKSALASHALFPDVYAIAWDYVVTPDGPFLLEGNTGWATRIPQIITGGLLSEPDSLII